MARNALHLFLLLALVAGGVQALPCVQMGFSHGCCTVADGAAVSNPYKKCCGAETDKGLPVLGASSLVQMDNHPILAVADVFYPDQKDFFSFVPFVNEHWGGAKHLPFYLEHVTLLL